MSAAERAAVVKALDAVGEAEQEEAAQRRAAARAEAETAKARVETAEARVRAAALLTVLDARGLVVDEAARQRIATCDNPQRLDGWLRRAVSVGDVAALLDDEG